MWLYLCLMLFFALTSTKKGQSRRKLFFGAMILVLLMGLKSEYVGNDTPSYIELFDRLRRLSTFIDPSSRFEMGYQVYNKIIGLFFDDYQALFIITAVLCIGCVCYGIRNLSRNWQYSLFLFVGLRFYYFFLSGIRQSMAVSIIIVAYVFLKKKKIIPFLILITLATTIHFSAFIFVLSWPLSKMKISRDSIIKLLLGILIIYFLFGPILNTALGILPTYYSHYLGTEAASTNNLSDIINSIIPCLFLLMAYSVGYIRIMKNAEKGNMEYTYLGEKNEWDSDGETQILFYLVAAGLSLFATKASILDRMVQIFWIFAIVSIPNILFSIKDKQRRTAWYMIITFFVIAYNLTLLIARPEWNAIVPYTFYWN